MGRLKVKTRKTRKKNPQKSSKAVKKPPRTSLKTSNSKKSGTKSKNSKKYGNKSKSKKPIKQLESEILGSVPFEDESPVPQLTRAASRDMLEQIMFRLPYVSDPLVGTPKQVQKELDALAKRMQRRINDNAIFSKIHLYMHGYLISVVLKKFPFIRGLQTVDIYQETLIALRFKAIPNFKDDKGMSFLNFAKMCIRRHLITLLNASKNRKKDQSINRAISLDSSPVKSNGGGEEDGRNTYSNIISDGKISVDKAMENNEAYEVTKNTLWSSLSEFERVVLEEYLSGQSYREVAKNISKRVKRRYNTKSIDNALLRIRKKAIQLKKYSKLEDLPIFLPKNK